MAALYKGFSIAKNVETRGKTFSTVNIETVKRDLLNHIYTIPGERVMHPKFGTRIPLMAFEPLDGTTLAIIEEDLRTVMNYDPRVRLVEIAMLPMPDHNAVIALVDLVYVETNEPETLRLEFPVGS